MSLSITNKSSEPIAIIQRDQVSDFRKGSQLTVTQKTDTLFTFLRTNCIPSPHSESIQLLHLFEIDCRLKSGSFILDEFGIKKNKDSAYLHEWTLKETRHLRQPKKEPK